LSSLLNLDYLNYKEGELIYKHNDPKDTNYILLKGEIKFINKKFQEVAIISKKLENFGMIAVELEMNMDNK